MKKLIRILLTICTLIALTVCLTACTTTKSSKINGKTKKSVIENGSVQYTKNFGSYIVKINWKENEEHSTNNKFFYVKNGTENDNRPNNISINRGTNKYKKEEHNLFKEAIYKQLVYQTSSQKDTTINGAGSKTENGDILYTFIIKSNESVTKQYYIVGNYEYILVHESVWNLDDEDEVDDVAKQIVNTFEWTKEQD